MGPRADDACPWQLFNADRLRRLVGANRCARRALPGPAVARRGRGTAHPAAPTPRNDYSATQRAVSETCWMVPDASLTVPPRSCGPKPSRLVRRVEEPYLCRRG